MTTTATSPSSLKPLLEFCANLDLTNPTQAKSELDVEFPMDCEFMVGLRQELIAALEAEEICTHGKSPMTWSRLFKASEESYGFSADVVDMFGAGPKHQHPEGEIDLCLEINGEPDFDGNSDGWTVYGKGSIHTPTVSNGRMLILYLLPLGAFKLITD